MKKTFIFLSLFVNLFANEQYYKIYVSDRTPVYQESEYEMRTGTTYKVIDGKVVKLPLYSSSVQPQLVYWNNCGYLGDEYICVKHPNKLTSFNISNNELEERNDRTNQRERSSKVNENLRKLGF